MGSMLSCIAYMDPMGNGIEATQPLGFFVALNGIQLDFVRQMVGFDRKKIPSI